jgi:hypothetical protein
MLGENNGNAASLGGACGDIEFNAAFEEETGLGAIQDFEDVVGGEGPFESGVGGGGRVVGTTEQHTRESRCHVDRGASGDQCVVDLSDIAVEISQLSTAQEETGEGLRSSRVGGNEDDLAALDDSNLSVCGLEKEGIGRSVPTVSAVSRATVSTISTAVIIARNIDSAGRGDDVDRDVVDD